MACFNKHRKAIIILMVVKSWLAVVSGDEPPKPRTSTSSEPQAPTVTTLFGQMKGYYMTTREGRKIAAFTSIPFAKSPVGNLRFQPPSPIEGWQGTLDATKETPFCLQRNPYIREKDIVGQEDCLFLNIYTPYSVEQMSSGPKLPVMVWFHGGGLMCGCSRTDMYGPEYLLDRDVVYVATNYRLGPLGFLSTQDENCPGNNGMKDQQEALRFVQKVIESFGGDRDSVTIFGESAGGASTHYHMLSKSSTGLFHKVISQSGVAHAPWVESPPGEAKRNAFRLAKCVHCPQSPSSLMMDCLRRKNAKDIIDTEFRLYAWDYEPMTPFKVVAEPKLPGAFLVKRVRDVNDVPTVPWMTGLNRDEGCLKSGWIAYNESRLEEFISDFDTIAPISFYYDHSPYAEVITKKIRDRYINSDQFCSITCSNAVPVLRKGTTELFTDNYFNYPIVEAVEQTFKYTKHPIYLYELTHQAANSFSQIFGFPDGSAKMVCHADDLMYLFPISFLKNPPKEKDLEVSKLMVNMFVNFATSGNPNVPVEIPVRWTPATSPSKREYLDISSKPSMKSKLAERSEFWGTLPMWHNPKTRQFVDEL